LGSAVELETGLKRFLTTFSNNRTSNTVDIIRVLCHLLTHSDSECVLNAAGTLGTIVCRFHTLNLWQFNLKRKKELITSKTNQEKKGCISIGKKSQTVTDLFYFLFRT
jgi:hypothetical protein